MSVWQRGSAVPVGEGQGASPHCRRPLRDLDRCLRRLGSKKLESDTLVSNVRVVTELSGQKECVSWGKDMDPRKGEPTWAIENPGEDCLDLTSVWGLNSR